MAQTWAQRAVLKASRYLQEAFAEPGRMHVFTEELFNLRSAACLQSFQALTDQEFGGQSTAELRFSTEEGEPEGCLVFEGRFSSEVPPTAPPDVHKLGQAAFGSKLQEGRYLWLGDYDRQVASTIDYRLKGDGRLYGLFMKTDSYVEGTGSHELWQTFVQTRRDEWTDHKVPVVDFLLTSGGYVADHQRVINLSRVTGLGFALSGGGEVQEEGPFKLCVSSIEAGYDLDRSSGNEE